MSFIYHIVPSNFTGNTLYPLNQLKIHLPEIYAEQVKKYTGREILTQYKIPLLNCLWNDVLHFSPVHPKQIRNAFVNVGFTWNPRSWFSLNPIHSGFNSENAVIFLSTPRPFGNFNIPETDFIPFSQEQLKKVMELPDTTLEYLKFAKNNRQRPFMFNHIPHILYLGIIDISYMEIINY